MGEVGEGCWSAFEDLAGILNIQCNGWGIAWLLEVIS